MHAMLYCRHTGCSPDALAAHLDKRSFRLWAPILPRNSGGQTLKQPF